MARISKKRKEALKKVEANKAYTLAEATKLVKEISYTKFDSSVDIDVRLGVDPKKANQMVRGVVALPHGTGKDIKVLALVPPDKEAEAKEKQGTIVDVRTPNEFMGGNVAGSINIPLQEIEERIDELKNLI